MGETKGSLEVRILARENIVFTEAKSYIEDSDSDRDMLRHASKINCRLSDLISQYQALKAEGRYLPPPEVYLKRCLEGG